jgi:predicted DsbA family dithiol-disulfide isomerase
VHVEIWSDIACPCCYIGKRRFEAALAGFEHRDEVGVTWRSFELDPPAPHERERDRAERLAENYGMTVEGAREMEQQMTDVAATKGLQFDGPVCAPQPAQGPTTAQGEQRKLAAS